MLLPYFSSKLEIFQLQNHFGPAGGDSLQYFMRFFSLHKGMCIIEKSFFFIKHAILNFHVGNDIFGGVS